jgi:hypothetical protein
MIEEIDNTNTADPIGEAAVSETQPHEAPNLQGSAERPDYLPEKFQTPEELADAYRELERKLSEAKQPNEQPNDAPAEALPPLPAQLSRFSEEFTQQGQLSEKSYAELEQQYGLPRAYVDHYIAGVQAKQNEYISAVHAETGGADGFQVVGEWARLNLPASDLAAIERALQSGDQGVATLAARGLFARYQDATGKEPNLIGGGAPSDGLQAFKSTAEVVAAMSDPRYAKDPAYRKEVEQRLAVSDVI